MGPLYLEIKDELLSLIENHNYREGETIPSEEELADAYGVSRPTVHRAVQMLVDAGVLERRAHQGTVVKTRKVSLKYAITLRSFVDEMSEHGRVPATKVIIAHKVNATDDIAAHLEISEGDEVFKLVRLRYMDGTPDVFAESYIPCALYPHIHEVDFTTSSLYAYFEDQGNPAVEARRLLEVMLADANFAALLDVRQGDPLFRFSYTTRDAKRRVVEYSICTYRGEGNAFELVTGINRPSS